jgi:hypothetical protein
MAKYLWKVWLRPNKLTQNPSDYVAEVDTAGTTRRQSDIIERIAYEDSESKYETVKAVRELAKYLREVWLRPNKLTQNPSDYVAEVDTAGTTRRQSDIIERIAYEGSEIKSETVKAVLDRANAVKQEFLLQGYSVFDDFIHLTPRVTGSWVGVEHFSEGHHKVTVDAVASKMLHEQFKQVGVEVLGVADAKSRIMLVTDVATQKTDGTITQGDDIIIAGNKIKLAGLPQPDGSFEPGINVFFVAADGITVIPAVRVSENMPSRIIARVPTDLTAGQDYLLRIVTRYSSSSSLLKEPRVIEYELPLVPQ